MKKLLKSGIYGTHKQYTYALFIVDKVNNCRLKKKKKKNAEEKRNMNPNGHLIVKPRHQLTFGVFASLHRRIVESLVEKENYLNTLDCWLIEKLQFSIDF